MEALLLVLNLPFAFIFGLFMGDYLVFLPVIILYFIAPTLDILVLNYFPDINSKNFFNSEAKTKTVDVGLKLYPFIQLLIFIITLYKLKTVDIFSLEFLSMFIGFGFVCGGTGLLIGHELMHRKDMLSKLGAIILTSMATYTHWLIEHLQGHHKNVGTLSDPCTARYNESLYRFLLRSVVGQYLSAYRINKTRFIILKLIEIMFALIILILFSWKGLVFYILQAFIGVFLLENVNYIEHYGLFRKELPNGKIEKMHADLSWDSYSILTNISLINLGFHADHHANVTKKFQNLKPVSKNIIRYGIPAQLLISMIPPLWFYTINPMIEDKARTESSSWQVYHM